MPCYRTCWLPECHSSGRLQLNLFLLFRFRVDSFLKEFFFELLIFPQDFLDLHSQNFIPQHDALNVVRYYVRKSIGWLEVIRDRRQKGPTCSMCTGLETPSTFPRLPWAYSSTTVVFLLEDGTVQRSVLRMINDHSPQDVAEGGPNIWHGIELSLEGGTALRQGHIGLGLGREAMESGLVLLEHSLVKSPERGTAHMAWNYEMDFAFRLKHVS